MSLAAGQYLRFPAGVDSTLFTAADGFPAFDCFGKEAERATSLAFTLSTGVDKVIGGHHLNYLESHGVMVKLSGNKLGNYEDGDRSLPHYWPRCSEAALFSLGLNKMKALCSTVKYSVSNKGSTHETNTAT